MHPVKKLKKPWEESERRSRSFLLLLNPEVRTVISALWWCHWTRCLWQYDCFFFHGVQAKTVKDARVPGPGPNPGGGVPAHVQDTGDSWNLQDEICSELRIKRSMQLSCCRRSSSRSRRRSNSRNRRRSKSPYQKRSRDRNRRSRTKSRWGDIGVCSCRESRRSFPKDTTC